MAHEAHEGHKGVDRADDDGAVEGHAFTGVDGVDTIDRTEDEGPDVEGHGFHIADSVDSVD